MIFQEFHLQAVAAICEDIFPKAAYHPFGCDRIIHETATLLRNLKVSVKTLS